MINLNKNTVSIVSSLVPVMIVAATVAVMAMPYLAPMGQLVDYTVHFVFGLLSIGIVALVFNHSKVMWAAFGSCAALCIFLKEASNDILVFPQEHTQQKLVVSQINLSSVNDAYADMIALLLEETSDVISFQEVDPSWIKLLSRDLALTYPYSAAIVRIDPYGMALFSKYPLQNTDTLYADDIPHLVSEVLFDGKLVRLISSYISPPLESYSMDRAKSQLTNLAHWVQESVKPVITLGDFNMVYWSPELINFKKVALVSHSRRESSPSMAKLPYEHIFFSSTLKCTAFDNLWNTDNRYVGVTGSYQHYSEDDTYQSAYTTLKGTVVR